MADCQGCGAKAGFGKKMCSECTSKEESRKALEQAEAQRQAEAHRLELAHRQAEQERVAKEERQSRLEAFVEGRLEHLTSLIESGVTPYLYETFIIDSQSYFRESPNPGAWSFKTATNPVGAPTDITYLQGLGWLGWTGGSGLRTPCPRRPWSESGTCIRRRALALDAALGRPWPCDGRANPYSNRQVMDICRESDFFRLINLNPDIFNIAIR